MLFLWCFMVFLVGPSPGEKRRQEARPTLWYVLQLREAAAGHPRTRGWDARSGLCLCCCFRHESVRWRQTTGVFRRKCLSSRWRNCRWCYVRPTISWRGRWRRNRVWKIQSKWATRKPLQRFGHSEYITSKISGLVLDVELTVWTQAHTFNMSFSN